MTATTLTRDSYGALGAAYGRTIDADRDLYLAAMALVQQAAKAGKLPAAYDDLEWDRKRRASGSARHHEIYDIAANGAAVLVCVRSTEGNKYGVRTTDKSYYLVARHGRGTRVSEASKAVAAKAAKAAGDALGLAIAVVTGKRPAPAPKCLASRTGYKIVRREGDRFVSVWDESEWAIGKSRIEAATPDHNGGFYFYADLDEAIDQAVSRQTFGDARQYHDLSILEVEVAGREFGETKRCATRVRPIREVAAIL